MKSAAHVFRLFVFPVFGAAFFAVSPLFVFAQEAGGAFNPFGGFDDESATLFDAGGVKVGGELSAGFTGYTKEIAEDAGHIHAGGIVKGGVTFSAKGDSAEAFVNLRLAPVFDNADNGQKSPVTLDEAYLTVFFGALTVDAGLRKLTWGKADNEGPLDVINPLDYADLSEIKPDEPPKIARPLVHAAFRFGDYSKIEGVFVPWFSGWKFADEGRWEPAQIKELKQKASLLAAQFGVPNIDLTNTDTTILSYFQTGARFSTTVFHSDIGIQYYTGFLPRPAYSVEMKNPPAITLDYNRYHQIGLDYAVEAAGFNIRAETAVNSTGDLSGDDPSVYNPHVLWSLGFDRSLGAGINLNLQCNEKIRLFDDGVGKKPFDIEDGASLTATRVTAEISRAFFRDTVRLSTAAIWGVEDKDIYLIPALTFTRGSAEVTLSGGFFLGDRNGELGQYHDNSFVKAVMKYVF
ncbi:MAG: hypothetical protein LBK61_12125 [Spirochaetaceae bacterium]|jgi:hypothetical protein|nr:hypothetical protein [Spirochaetaceae bacterium]